MLCNFFTIPQFWNDVKDLKRDHIKGLKPNFEFHDGMDNLDKLLNYPFLESICNYIDNNFLMQKKDNVAYGKQPFIIRGIELWKLDWATDRKGSRGGLRLLYYTQKTEKSIYIVLMKKKSECSIEHKLMNEIIRRTKLYFCFDQKQ